MSSSKQLDLRKRIGKVMQSKPNMKKNAIVEHFFVEGVPKRTTYYIIQRVKIGKSVKRKSVSGQIGKRHHFSGLGMYPKT